MIEVKTSGELGSSLETLPFGLKVRYYRLKSKMISSHPLKGDFDVNYYQELFKQGWMQPFNGMLKEAEAEIFQHINAIYQKTPLKRPCKMLLFRDSSKIDKMRYKNSIRMDCSSYSRPEHSEEGEEEDAIAQMRNLPILWGVKEPEGSVPLLSCVAQVQRAVPPRRTGSSEKNQA